MKRKLIIEIDIPDGLDSDATVWQNYHDAVNQTLKLGQIKRLIIATKSCIDRSVNKSDYEKDPIYLHTIVMNDIANSCVLIGEVLNGAVDYYDKEIHSLTSVEPDNGNTVAG